MNSTKNSGLPHFFWNEESTGDDYDEYMLIFKSYLITSKCNYKENTTVVEGATGSQRAVAALLVAGGPIMVKSIRAIEDYDKKSYEEIKVLLDAEYKIGSAIQNLTRFNRCKPTTGEKFIDYAKRLIQLGRKCDRKDDKSLLAHVSQWYPNDELAKECMKKDATMKLVMEWAINEDVIIV